MNTTEDTSDSSPPAEQGSEEVSERPEGSDPTADLPDPSEVPTDLRVAFWTLVFLLKFAIVATSLGALFVVFENNWDLGGPLLGLGGLCFLFAIVRYRRYRGSGGGDGESDAPG